MQTYRPRPPRKGMTVDELAEWMHQELQNIQKAANTGSDGLPVNVLYAAPAKPKNGWHYVADGSQWNPGGGGKGTYRYDGNGTFTKVG